MPKLIVYVPASLWRRIEELGLADPKVEARKVAVGALEQLVNGSLSERVDVGRAEVHKPEAVTTVTRSKSDPPPSRSTACAMNVPRGTRCKSCGKVHQ